MTAFGQRECWCGKSYAPTSDGRWIHRKLFGHTPCEPRPVPPPPVIVSGRCQHDRHRSASDGCGGGVMHHGQPIACACWCHGGSDICAGQAYNRDNSEGPRIGPETPLTNKTVGGL